VLAVKSVSQHYTQSSELLVLLVVFRRMVNESIRIGIANDASSLRRLSQLSYNQLAQYIRIGLANDLSSLRRLSQLSYNQLAQYDSPSCYKLCAISRVAGILASRKKSRRRGLPSRTPYAVRQQLVSCYGFKTKKRRAGDSDREREASSIP